MCSGKATTGAQPSPGSLTGFLNSSNQLHLLATEYLLVRLFTHKPHLLTENG